MKRIVSGSLAALLTLSLILSLAGCGNSAASASDKALSCAQQAADVGQSYLDGKYSADKAVSLLADLEGSMSYAKDYTQEERSQDRGKAADYYLASDITYLRMYITSDKINSTPDSYSKVQDKVSDLQSKIKKYS